MPHFVDVRGRAHRFERPPRRIISLVPSLTATLLDLGAGDLLAACTDYCALPPDWTHLPRVGGTKNPKRFEIVALRPDLVLVNREENRLADASWLEERGLCLFATEPRNPAQALADIDTLTRLLAVGDDPALQRRLQGIAARMARLQAWGRRLGERGGHPTRFLAPIWKHPWMTGNDDTYFSALLSLGGAENVFGRRQRRFPLAYELGVSNREEAPDGQDRRYPRFTLGDVAAAAPDIILLPDEPYAFTAADAEALLAAPELAGTPAVREGRVHLIAGRSLVQHSLSGLEETLTSLEEGPLHRYLSLSHHV